MKAAEIFNIFITEMKVFNIFNHLLQTCCNSKTAATRIHTIEHIENYSLIGRVLKIALHHG